MTLPWNKNKPQRIFYSPQGNPEPQKPHSKTGIVLALSLVILVFIAGGIGFYLYQSKLGPTIIVDHAQPPSASPTPVQTTLPTAQASMPIITLAPTAIPTPLPTTGAPQTSAYATYTSPTGLTLAYPSSWILNSKSWTEGKAGVFTMTPDMEVALRFLDPNQTSASTTNDSANSTTPPNGISFIINKPVNNPSNTNITTWAAQHAYDPGNVQPITIGGVAGAMKETHENGYTADYYVLHNSQVYSFHVFFYPDPSQTYLDQVTKIVTNVSFTK